VTIIVAANYTVRPSQTLHFSDGPAFAFDGDNQPTLLNRGTVQATSETYAWGVDGRDVAGHFINAEGATFRIVAGDSGARALGFGTNAHGADFRNDGLFEVTAGDNNAYGVILDDAGPAVVNNGTFKVTSDAAAIGVHFNDRSGDVLNTGTMEISGGEATALNMGPGGFTFTNSGSLTVTSADGHGTALRFFNFESSVATFVNSGFVQADNIIVEEQHFSPLQLTKAIVVNSGEMRGVLDLGFGDDEVHNTGVMTGDIEFGDQNDLYDGARGAHAGLIIGGFGADTLNGGRGGDVIYGDEVANSDAGRDFVSGGKGSDRLFGGSGNDTVVGGAGVDQLGGGLGKDFFVFARLQDSTGLRGDLVSDLQSGDTIDLSQIDANATVAGDQAFDLVSVLGGHAGELALRPDSSHGQTILEGDVDGDGLADFRVRLTGDHIDFASFVL
jgi:Ca2+-binding RTX toxin-like protein